MGSWGFFFFFFKLFLQNLLWQNRKLEVGVICLIQKQSQKCKVLGSIYRDTQWSLWSWTPFKCMSHEYSVGYVNLGYLLLLVDWSIIWDQGTDHKKGISKYQTFYSCTEYTAGSHVCFLFLLAVCFLSIGKVKFKFLLVLSLHMLW